MAFGGFQANQNLAHKHQNVERKKKKVIEHSAFNEELCYSPVISYWLYKKFDVSCYSLKSSFPMINI